MGLLVKRIECVCIVKNLAFSFYCLYFFAPQYGNDKSNLVDHYYGYGTTKY